MSRTLRTTVTVCAALALAGGGTPALAKGGAMSEREQKMRQVSGEVLQTKQVEVRGGEQTNLIALVKTRKGDDRLAIDLGKADAFRGQIQGQRQAQGQSGQDALLGKQLAAEGRVIELRDRVFLVAHRAKVDGQMVRIDRQAQQRHARTQQQDARRPQDKRRQVSGTVLEAKTVDVRGTDAQNVVAMLRTDKSDRRLIVDLGSAENIDLTEIEGKQVALEGKLIELGDEQVLVTDRIRIGSGQEQKIHRQQDEHARQHSQRQQARAPTSAVSTGR